MLGPILWGPGSELLGRRPIFLFTMVAFTLLHLGQCLAPNIETLLVTRFLTGFFGVAPLSNCGGTSLTSDNAILFIQCIHCQESSQIYGLQQVAVPQQQYS
jgi:MFS family permease